MDPEALFTLTALRGRSARTAEGRAAGVVRDLTVRLGDDRLRVEQVLVVRRGIRRLVPWSAVALEGDRVVLRVATQGAGPPDQPRLHADELFLGRDVIDCQVVDMVGRRLTRASDVVLSRTTDGVLALVGVEVGGAAVLRRLGFGWLAGRLRRRVVPVDQLHLTSARGHEVQLAVPTSALHRLDAEGLAHLLTTLAVGKATDVIRSVGPARAAEALLKLHPVVGRRLMSALAEGEFARVRRHLPHGSAETHPHLHQRALSSPRRLRRLAGWRTHRPPGVSG